MYQINDKKALNSSAFFTLNKIVLNFSSPIPKFSIYSIYVTFFLYFKRIFFGAHSKKGALKFVYKERWLYQQYNKIR
jgi:hypothetical protein